ncbi:MAG: hypothetical protein ACK4TI_03085, partial [Nitrososphaerales archaeon]
KLWLSPLIGVILALSLAASLNLASLNQKINLRQSQPLDALSVQSEEALKAPSRDLTAENMWQLPPLSAVSLFLVAASVAATAYLMLNRFIYEE